MQAVGNNGPAVVFPRQGAIDFIAALRAMLAGPQLAGYRMQSSALNIPVPVGPDFRPCSFHVDERVGIRDAAIGMKDRKSTRLNSSHVAISYAVFCLKKKSLA